MFFVRQISVYRWRLRSCLLLGILFIVGLSVLAMSKHLLGAASEHTRMVVIPALAQEKPVPLVVEEITLRSTGFHPAKLSRPKGEFLLVVCNRSGQEELNISLVRDVGNGIREKLKDAKVHRKVLDWNNKVDLNPGTYLLTETSNPKWVCELTITSK